MQAYHLAFEQLKEHVKSAARQLRTRQSIPKDRTVTSAQASETEEYEDNEEDYVEANDDTETAFALPADYGEETSDASAVIAVEEDAAAQPCQKKKKCKQQEMDPFVYSDRLNECLVTLDQVINEYHKETQFIKDLNIWVFVHLSPTRYVLLKELWSRVVGAAAPIRFGDAMQLELPIDRNLSTWKPDAAGRYTLAGYLKPVVLSEVDLRYNPVRLDSTVDTYMSKLVHQFELAHHFKDRILALSQKASTLYNLQSIEAMTQAAIDKEGLQPPACWHDISLKQSHMYMHRIVAELSRDKPNEINYDLNEIKRAADFSVQKAVAEYGPGVRSLKTQMNALESRQVSTAQDFFECLTIWSVIEVQLNMTTSMLDILHEKRELLNNRETDPVNYFLFMTPLYVKSADFQQLNNGLRLMWTAMLKTIHEVKAQHF
jgi:hypothetical protein